MTKPRDDEPHRPSSLTTILATVMALVAFAANSLLCRAALGAKVPTIDAGSFTAVRIVSGAMMLALIVALRRTKGPRFAGTWLSGLALFVYAITFSLAYRQLQASVGALVLFGSVQLTMIAWGLRRGERPRLGEWIGWAAALAGLTYLMAVRSSTAPPLVAVLLMGSAGIAWGIYSLRGRGAGDPVAATAGNFALAVPFALLTWLILFADWNLTTPGLLLAALSGAVTSALGYVIWYVALPGLTALRAALVQLSVPVLTGLAAVALLGERITTELLVSSALVLGGIGLAIVSRLRRK